MSPDESRLKNAEDLEVGEKFEALHLTGRRLFGIRSQIYLTGTEEALWYTDLETGDVAILPGLLEVEILPTFIDLLVRVHEMDVKPIDSMEDLLNFFGDDNLNPFPSTS